MSPIDLTSPAQLKDLLAQYGFHSKKRFGQNFLVDRNIAEKIIDSLDLNENDAVIEIGPGAGTLTQLIAPICREIVAIEIDRNLIDILDYTLCGFSNINIINADILSVDLVSLINESFGHTNVKIVGNLPYYITSPILERILEAKQRVTAAVFMMQREVADRLRAMPGSREYGAMSIYVQYHSKVDIISHVSKNVFLPPPEVSSSIVLLKPHKAPPIEIPNEELFFKVVHAAFGKRRKTLLNSLSDSLLGISKSQVQELLESAAIDPLRRAETLTMEEFAAIARILAKNID